MRYKHLDLNLLVALNALLNERSISRAAVSVHLSQPAMSAALARLREHFKDELLVPNGRSMMLTARAQSLMQPVQHILLQIDSSISEAPLFEPAQSQRRFSVTVSDYTLEVYVPSLLSKLHTEASGVKLQLGALTNAPHQILESGEVDFLFIPEQYVSKDHPCTPVFRDEFVVIAWSEHSQLRTSEQLSLHQYLECGHIAASFGNGSGRNLPVLESWFMERVGLERRIDITVPSIAALPNLVVGTDRLATVHKRLALKAQKALPIKIWHPPMETPPFVQMMQWHKHRDKDPGLAWLRKLCIDVGCQI